MARKRLITVEEKEAPPAEPSDDKEEKEQGWGQWLRKTYLKYWYGVGCLFVDAIVAMEAMRLSGEGGSAALPIFLFLVLLIVEIFLYEKIWGIPRFWGGR